MDSNFCIIDSFIHNINQIKYITVNYLIDTYRLFIYYSPNEDECIRHDFCENKDNEIKNLIEFLSNISPFKDNIHDIAPYLKKIKSMER